MTKEQILWEISKNQAPYPLALDRMERISRDIRSDNAAERVWLLEHPPLFTSGTSAKPEDLFNPHHYPTYHAGRGGQWTYHGPGQRTAYVMLDLARAHAQVPPRDLRAYVHALESWVITALAHFGLKGEVREGRVGVWVTDPATGREEKIAAIGVRVSRWVSWHGVAINLCPDMADFDGIVPCGIRDFGVTSFRKLGLTTTLEELDAALMTAWEKVFGSVPSPLREVELSEAALTQG
ncbi:lipoyl(octanoyl) transferase LipB [Acetobacter sp. TBRC 12305]|uniref:Octanoyltransferase n=1 Tax=Acetobacter garciniae TaxID=2817435 RepID=A0A939HM18_9PROT|nr:lipoyl(octanoyl) transferase LipB [Acetobacter garciniae]MBO1324104.1 lipoyl(octanoyl) transferase LipB [Acetobacter garciniae]MBX0343793.1 lipoyl(octanoyl) transferase LipB [Acetobacter garciniae]